MNSIQLPKDFSLDQLEPIQLYNYNSFDDITKQEIILSKHTFSFLIEGKKEVYADNASFAIDSSHFLLMKSGHCLMTEKLSKTKQYTSLLLFFSNELLTNFITKYNIKEQYNTTPLSAYVFPYDTFISRFKQSLLDISKLPKATQHHMLALKLEELLLYLLELGHKDFLFSLLHQHNNQTHHFFQTIEQYKLNKLTLKELAFLCNMSVSTFKRNFEKHFNTPPIKWFTEKRLDYAFQLIQKEHKRPSDIYEAIGYESLSSFIQAYKTKFGTTPKQHQL